jgi:membrane associated rhomboid family serine protease
MDLPEPPAPLSRGALSMGTQRVGQAIEVFRSTSRARCAERALVLDALGIPSEMHVDGFFHVLMVDESDTARALQQLAQYQLEVDSQRLAAPEPAQPDHPYAWIGCAVYAAVLIFVALAIANGLGRLDAFGTGELDAGRVQAGQWWRAWTALTLHLDGEHLAANLAAGIWFGYLAGRHLGVGHMWFLTVTGAAAANLLEALLGPSAHRAVGASTAVFTTLGLLSAHAWRLRAHSGQRRLLQWAPLVAGVVLLGWTGSGGDAPQSVDVVAHVMGFATGAALGVVAALQQVRRLLLRVPQWATGLAALAQIVIAWGFALRS